jgi:CheY-like chemotaxis protein
VARVLVVDDEPDLRELVRISLQLAGHEVSVCADGGEGLDAVRRDRPDVVVLDVMMPVMDGWDVLSRLKSDPDASVASIPVLMLTARADELDAIRGGIEGAVHYLTKPFSIEDLRSAVLGVLVAGPEPALRRAAQEDALVRLARLERGTSGPAGRPPGPRMTRLEPGSGVPQGPSGHSRDAGAWPSWLASASMTARDREILEAVMSCATLGDARATLQLSRSYLYSRLRHLAHGLGFSGGPALVRALHAANALAERPPRPGPSR